VHQLPELLHRSTCCANRPHSGPPPADGLDGMHLKNVCAQLIVRYQLPHRTLPKDATRDSGFLSQLLREAAGARDGQPVVVIVDALDEAVDPIDPASPHQQNPPNRLYLPHNLHDGVFFVITTREQAHYRLSVDRIKDIYVRDNDPRNMEDVQRYVSKFVHEHAPKMVPAIAQWGVDETQFAAIICERSQGNFMYLVHVLRDIRDGSLNKSNIENIRNLPRGLTEYYWRHWKQMANENEARFTTLYKPVICMLAAVREAVSVTRVSDWTKLPPSDIKRVIREWRPFLNEDETEGAEVRYRIYHTSFQEFLRDEIGLVAQHQVISEAALSKIPGFQSS
jgi:hypothetical protein